MASSCANLLQQKKCLHEKRVQLPILDWFGPPTVFFVLGHQQGRSEFMIKGSIY